ncbi:hypothetical protein DFN09_004335 [Clostridium acetobutylicum]|nr:hypothetical protein [Clostridium acetobutylicum]
MEFLFKSNDINKVNIIVDEEVSTQPFVELGFAFEGIINKSIIEKMYLKMSFYLEWIIRTIIVIE